MKKTKKNLVLSLCAGALSLFCATGVVAVKANADVTEDTDGKVSVSSLTMIKTASAYIGDVTGAEVTGGIRFDATLSKADYDALNKNYNAVKYGMLVTPSDCIATDVETDLYIGSATLPAYDASKTYTSTDKFYYDVESIPPVYDTEEYPDVYTFRCAVTGLASWSFSRPYTARAYIATQKEADGAWEYTYTDSCQRAIYSIATYAMNDNLTFFEDADKQQAVESYLNGIIDTVQQYYDISVTQTVNDGTATEAKIGDTITLNGVATKIGDTSKTLDMCPTVTVAENSALTPVANTQGRKYKVTGLGDVAYTWTSGAKSGESQVSGQTKLDILTDEASLSNLVIKGARAQIVPVDENHEGYNTYVKWSDGSYNYQKTNAVFAWSLKEGATQPGSGDEETVAFSFDSNIIKYMKKDIYVYMDIVIPGNSSTSATAYGLPFVSYAGKKELNTLLYSKVGSEYHQYYSQSGANLGNGTSDDYNLSWSTTRVNTWLRLGFPLRDDWNDSLATYISHYATTGSFRGTIYLSDMFLSSENLEDAKGNIAEMEYTKELIPYVETLKPTAFSLSTDSTCTYSQVAEGTEIGGRTGVYAYHSDVKGNGSRIYMNSATRNKVNKHRYFTFDIYLDEPTNFLISTRSDTGNPLHYVYHATTGDKLDNDTSKMIVYNANKEIVSGSKQVTVFTKAEKCGQWYTVEIYYKGTASLPTSNYSWGTYIACMNKTMSDNKFVYIDNVRVSNYSLMANA